MVEERLEAVPDVEIEEGRFKYVLIKVSGDGMSKFIVRGYNFASYHADVYERVEPGIRALGLSCDCVGGGRILHEAAEKKILVYGYSMGFGKADHSITVEKLKTYYPNYESITFSNEGY